MKVFSVEVPRTRVVKVLVGLAAIAFVIRAIMGVADEAILLGITVDGFEKFVYVTLAAAAVLLLWDIRDKVAGG